MAVVVQVGFVASFVSKLSDTVSSEIGKVSVFLSRLDMLLLRFCPLRCKCFMEMEGTCVQAYGKTAYLITTLKPVPRGTEGAVSLEGTTAGIAAAAVFSAVALFLKLVRTANHCNFN